MKLVAITLAALLVFNFTFFRGAFNKVFEILQPIFVGIVFALILNMPLEFLEKRVLKKIKRQGLKRFLSLALSIAFFLGILALVFGLALPAAAKSMQKLYSQVADQTIWQNLRNHGGFTAGVGKYGELAYNFAVKNMGNVVPKALSLAHDVFRVVINLVLGLAIAIMLLAHRENLKAQLSKTLTKLCKRERIVRMAKVGDIAFKKFSRYLGGAVIEAFILGIACFIFMSILRLPYAALISLIIGFVNLIPYIGAYLGGAVSTIIIFAVSPVKALIFIIFIVILQQVEAFTTYPVIVGKYVGLNGFWIVVSVVVWGGVFGFWGIFLGVPFTAFLHDYIKALPDKAPAAQTENPVA